MRIDLVTPFAEKDAAKALGARWDAAKKTWYIADVTDLTPFARWIPDMKAGPGKPAAAKPAVGVPHCGCLVLPWEDCPHTTNQ